MPVGDDLTIVTFFVSIGIGLGGSVMSALGWKHPALISTLSLAGILCFGMGVGWPWIKEGRPELQAVVLRVAQNPASWVCVFLVLVAAFVTMGRQNSALKAALVDAKTVETRANQLARAITASLPSSTKAVTEQTFDSGITRRSVNVCLTNDGDGWLTRCLLELISITPDPPHEAFRYPLAFGPSCDLLKGMSRPIVIAAYNRVSPPPEIAQTVYTAGPTLHFPMLGGYDGGHYVILAPEQDYKLRLRASAAECQSFELDVRVWVGPGRVLMASTAS